MVQLQYYKIEEGVLIFYITSHLNFQHCSIYNMQDSCFVPNYNLKFFYVDFVSKHFFINTFRYDSFLPSFNHHFKNLHTIILDMNLKTFIYLWLKCLMAVFFYRSAYLNVCIMFLLKYILFNQC